MTTDHELLRVITDMRKRAEANDKIYLFELEDFADRLQSLLSGGWQDISTAPKDGTKVFVYVKGDSLYPTAASFNSREYFEEEYGDPDYMEEGWYWEFGYPSDFHECVIEPTHWMPLPLKPTGEL